MADYPAMPLWTDAYISDTQHLTNEEHGVYLRLLMFAWRTPDCSLPTDEKRLAIMVGLTGAQWRKLSKTVLSFFTEQDEKLIQKKQKIVRNFVDMNSLKQSRIALAREAAKRLKLQDQPSTSLPPQEHHESTRLPPTKTKTKTKGVEERISNDILPPPPVGGGGFSDDEFGQFLTVLGFDPNGHIPECWEFDCEVILGWFDLPLTAAQIIAAARDSRKIHVDPPATPQALNSFMDQAAAVPSANLRPSQSQIMQSQADMINGAKFCPASVVTPSQARSLIQAGLVTQDRLNQRGIAS